MKRLARPGIFYGWVIVLISFLTLVLAMGSRLTFGVFYMHILADTGWSRASTAGIFSVSMLVYAVTALGVGAAFDRLGPRCLFPLAALVLSLGFFLCSRITALWEFYIYYGVIVGFGFTALGFIPHVSLIARWFQRQRGLATSLVLAGMGVGVLIFAPLGEYLIAHYGWRKSYLIYAVLTSAVLIPLNILFHRSSPASLGLHPDGDRLPRLGKRKTVPVVPPAGWHFYTRLLQTPAFWALFFIVFTIAFNLMMLLVHQNQYLVDIGFEPEFAAWMLGLNGILRSGGSIIWGSLSDRITREMSFTIASLLGFGALLCLISAQASPSAWRVLLFVLLLGLGYGGAPVLYGTSAADLFQGPHFGKILGILEIGFGLGAGIGSYVAGVLFDRFHSYHIAFYVVLGLVLVSIAGIWIAAPRSARPPAIR